MTFAPCTCGHAQGDHQSSGAGWPHPPRYGTCLIRSCACRRYHPPEEDPDVSNHLRVQQASLLAEQWIRSTDTTTRRLGADLKQVLGLEDELLAGWNRPAPASADDVVSVLCDAAVSVRASDSLEGTITWSLPAGEPELESADFGLVARYRIGNRDGQGGLRVFEGTPR